VRFLQLGEYHAATTSILMMVFLGFADDVLDLRWAIKIILSFTSTLPLLIAYQFLLSSLCLSLLLSARR
jgi:UDP-N-acetylmuramyl pentapeptide phosphotransferase/UDP-N-acetylglucosamine-1-phosphate transferase